MKGNFLIEKVCKRHHRSVIDLMQEISNFEPNKEELSRIWDDFNNQGHVHSVVAIHNDIPIAFGTLVIEKKIRGGTMGHVEDIVTRADFRGKGVGKAIVNELSKIAIKEGCYKVSLACKELNIKFYEKCGYLLNGTSMQLIF